jgi:hypothetical protein
MVSAEVIDDTVGPVSSWVFSRLDCGCPPCLGGCSFLFTDTFDLKVAFIFHPPLGIAIRTPYGGQPLGAVPIDAIRRAPDDGYEGWINAQDNEEPAVGRTYALRTRDGGHALLTPLAIDPIIGVVFTYRYQPDGTGIFPPPSATERTTWSRIKSFEYGEAP